MSTPCADCGGPTVWDDAAASDICTSCGSLTDASQIILANQDYRTESGMYPELRDPAAPNILKSRSNYTLAGQGQAVRDQKNALTMANFIKSLAVSMNASGLTPRATTLFNQAKAINYFRWGARARTVAGACLSLALRESNRPDSIHDISTLLRCSPQLLSRTFISLASALKITTLAVDPSVYIGTLQGYVTTILQENQADCNLPPTLINTLRQLNLRAVTNTAVSLGRILSRSYPSHTSSKPSAASTACAIFILSVEAESREPLAALADLAKCLAGRCHIGKTSVMSQYKHIQDQVAILVEKVPWLEKYEQKAGRAKVSKRLVVARGLKDVIRFNEEILQNLLLPDVPLELSDQEKSEDILQDNGSDGGSHPSSETENNRPTKRRKIHQSLDEASQFLLNPNCSRSPRMPTQVKPRLSSFPLTSYVLSTSSLSSVSHRPPTRLQLLAAARGGSDDAAIPDDELFDNGELEALIRNDEEVALMRQILNFDDNGDNDGSDTGQKRDVAAQRPSKTRAGKGKPEGLPGPSAPKKSRVNLEAFSKFMQGIEESDNDDNGEGAGVIGAEVSFSLLGLDDTLEEAAAEEDERDDYVEHIMDDSLGIEFENSSLQIPFDSEASNGIDEGEETVLDAWRPASPSGAHAHEDRYEEEYD